MGRRRKLKLAAPWQPMSEAPRDGKPILIMAEDGYAAHICVYCDDGDWWRFTGFAMGSTWEAMGTLSEAGYCGWLPLPNKVIDQLLRYSITVGMPKTIKGWWNPRRRARY